MSRQDTFNPGDAPMTTTFKRTLFQAVADRDLTTLETMMDATADRLQRQHITNGIAHVRRALLPAMERDFLDRNGLSTATGVDLDDQPLDLTDVFTGPVPPPVPDPIQDSVAADRASLVFDLT